MTARTWDAEKWHRQHTHRPTRNPLGSASPNRNRNWLAFALIVGIAASGAATAGTALAGTDSIGVCHATGDTGEPFVFLLVAEDGFEHGHHRSHDGDFFIDPTTGYCASDAALPVIEEESAAVGDVIDEEVVDGLEDPGNETDADDGLDDAKETTDDTADDAEDVGNETEEAVEAPFAGDVAVSQSTDQDDHQVLLTIVVESIGSDNVSDVSLADQLPDVRRPWLLAGDDASACVLDGNDLSCWFGDLPAGESVSITLQAYTDRIPCGESMTNTAVISAAEDVESRNDASSAGILARYC